MSRKLHITIFLSIFSIILVLGNYYIFNHIANAFSLTGATKTYLALALAALSLTTISAMPLTRLMSPQKAKPLAWVAFSWMGMLLLLFTTFLISDILWVITAITTHIDPDQLRQTINLFALCIAGILTVKALRNGLSNVIIKNVTVKIDRLPPSFDGCALCRFPTSISAP